MMSVALTSSSAPAAARQEPLRVMVVDDSVVIRGLISRWIEAEPDMVVAARCAPAATRSTRSSASIPMSPCSTSRCRTRRHFGAAVAAGEEAQSHHHHGFDADPPQRGDQLQGAVARRLRLYSEARKHPRSRRRRNLSPRSRSEDPPSRRQGPPARAPASPARRWRRRSAAARAVAALRSRCRTTAPRRSARRRRARC